MENKRKKLWCLSYKNFSNIAFDNRWDENVPQNIAIISIINSKDCNCGEKHICKNSNNVLNLEFDDVSPVNYKTDAQAESYQIDEGKIVRFFHLKLAKKTYDFIQKNKGKDFYIHCSAGLSRSQAIVRFIKDTIRDINWETNPNNPCLFPNGFVYQQLMKIYRNEYYV